MISLIQEGNLRLQTLRCFPKGLLHTCTVCVSKNCFQKSRKQRQKSTLSNDAWWDQLSYSPCAWCPLWDVALPPSLLSGIPQPAGLTEVSFLRFTQAWMEHTPTCPPCLLFIPSFGDDSPSLSPVVSGWGESILFPKYNVSMCQGGTAGWSYHAFPIPSSLAAVFLKTVPHITFHSSMLC